MKTTQDKSFAEKLTGAIERNNSLLCIGLDPDPKKYPAYFSQPLDDAGSALTAWGKAIIEQTADLVCCYKPNFAFYEQFGPPGLAALRETIAAVPADIPILLDAKRGDIGSTAAAYARAAFEIWGADAITLSPYLGQDSLTPFLDYPGKTVFVLCYTSNPSAEQIQEFGREAERLFENIAQQGQNWGEPEQVGFVVGATQPDALGRVRALAPDRWILAPGVGAQGGDLNQAMIAGLDRNGSGLIVPVSRSVIYTQDSRAAAQTLRDEINTARHRVKGTPSVGSPHTELILQLHDLGCIQFGNFILVSGHQSPIYIDLRRLMSSPSLLRRAARAYADLIRSLSFDHLAAVPYAALTIGTAVSLTINRSLIYPRKDIKVHGTGRSIEGRFSAGEKVVIVEDVITTGGSVLSAIESLEIAGLVVEDVVVLIDREQGGRQTLLERGYHLQAAFRLSDILDVLHQAGRISTEKFTEVKVYLGTEG
jgi:uridine monophosphate synthetase